MVPENIKLLKTFQKRFSRNSEDAEALLDLGKSCFLAELYEQATKAYKRVIQLDQANDSAYFNLGVAYQAQGKYTLAKQAFLKTLEINPNNESAQQALSSLTDY